MTRVRLAVDATTGRAVASKRATEPDAQDRLRHEATMLEAARHPGVAELVGLTPSADGLELTTAFISGPTLTDLLGGSLALPEIAAIVIDLAVTVGDLHERGIAHGRVDPSHVVVNHDGRPVLCGFADATWARDPSPAAAARSGGSGDVAALARVLEGLLPVAAPGAPGVEGVAVATINALRSIVANATAPRPAAHPSARSLAAAIRAAVPDARRPGSRAAPGPDPLAATPAEPTSGGSSRRSRLALAPSAMRVGRGIASVTVGVAMLAIVLATAGGSRSGPGAPLPAGDAPVPAGPAREGSTIEDAPLYPAAPGTVPAGPIPALETDGVVRLGAARFAVGEAGDIVLLADWSCRGVVVPAVVRPATGAVFVFPRWPEGDDELTVSPVARAGSVAGAVAVTGPTGCTALELHTHDGRRVTVEP